MARAALFLVEVTTADLDTIASPLKRGSRRASLGEVLPMEAARQAHEMPEGRRLKPRGKIVPEVLRSR
jgi:hypothetical protein